MKHLGNVGWISKKRYEKYILLALAILAVVSLVKYKETSRKYPFYIASVWQCNTPPCSVEYFRDENEILTSFEELEWKGETIQIKICFLMNRYDVYPAASSAYEDRLFGGTWKYRGKDFVLNISEDYLFENTYSELVFSPITLQ